MNKDENPESPLPAAVTTTPLHPSAIGVLRDARATIEAQANRIDALLSAFEAMGPQGVAVSKQLGGYLPPPLVHDASASVPISRAVIAHDQTTPRHLLNADDAPGTAGPVAEPHSSVEERLTARRGEPVSPMRIGETVRAIAPVDREAVVRAAANGEVATVRPVGQDADTQALVERIRAAHPGETTRNLAINEELRQLITLTGSADAAFALYQSRFGNVAWGQQSSENQLEDLAALITFLRGFRRFGSPIDF